MRYVCSRLRGSLDSRTGFKFSSLLTLILLTLLLTIAGESYAATYYVSPTGYDTAPGTSSAPWATFAHAMTVVGAGDTLYLMNGTYTQPLNISKSGTSSAYITVKAMNEGSAIVSTTYSQGSAMTINGSYVEVDGINFRNSGTYSSDVYCATDTSLGVVNGISVWGSYVNIRRCTINGASGCNSATIGAGYGTNVLMEDCAASGGGRVVLNIQSGNNYIIRRCWLNWTGPNTGGGDTMNISQTYGTNNTIFENCIGTNFTSTNAQGYTTWGHYGSISGNAFYGNIMYNSGNTVQGAFVDAAETGYTVSGTIFSNNVSIENGTGGQAAESINASYSNGSVFTNNTFVSPNSTGGGLLLAMRPAGAQQAAIANGSYNSFLNTWTGYSMQSGAQNYLLKHDYNNFYNMYGGGGDYYDTTYMSSPVPATHDTSFNPSYPTSTYGYGAYLMVPSALKQSGANIGATVLYEYVNGSLTSTPLWPWPMESRIVAEFGKSPTYTNDGNGHTGGFWNTLTGVYEGSVSSYTITATAGTGGSITPSGATTVNSGGNQTYTITPSSGYSITSVLVDGASAGAVGSYTFSNVTANHTISATFTVTTYTITATAGTGGSITPSGATKVNSGGSQTYTITPSSGYSISGVLVDGASVGAVSSYAFGGVTANHTISATFTTAATYTITATAGANGSISPSGSVTVNQNASQSFTITPKTGYVIAGMTVDGASVGAVSSYTFSTVTANHTIAATFAIDPFTITAAAGTGGSISPSGSLTVNYGSSQSFTITPAANYQISNVTVDGASAGAVSSYTFSNVTANHTISATFTAVTVTPTSYTITATAGTGGSISPSGATTVNSGSSQAYTITPSSGYSISSVLVDGASAGAVGSYTFSNVTANHTISATFAAVTSQPTVFATRAGGGQYTSQSGIVYKADTGYLGGNAASTTAPITGTSDPALYQSERYGNFSYNIPLTNGNYIVTLKFAENYWNAAGKRVFNVSMQGTQVISNLDLYSKAGKYAAYDVTIPVSVTKGTLNINFSSVVDYAKVDAIVVTSGQSATSFADNAGGGQYTSQSGTVYQADMYYSGGTTASVTTAITGTSDPALYQTERYGNFAYNIPLANGNYTVTLKFAETYWNAAGKRVFNVSMQGAQVISNLDLYAKAGKNAAYDVTIPVSVTNGILNINFSSVVDYAKVDAIAVTPN